MVPETFRKKLYRIIFGTDTPPGQYFDIVLIYLILLSVLANARMPQMSSPWLIPPSPVAIQPTSAAMR